MTVFSCLGGTSDIKIYLFAIWFLKICICDVTVAAPYMSIDFQNVFSIPWPAKCYQCTLCHLSNFNDLVSYETDDDENQNWAVQKETPRMLTVKYSHCEFSLLDIGTGLNMKEHFTSFSFPEDLSFWDWWRIGSLFLRSCSLIVDSITLDETKWNKARVRGDKTGNQGYSLLGEADQGFQKGLSILLSWHFLWKAHIDFLPASHPSCHRYPRVFKLWVFCKS